MSTIFDEGASIILDEGGFILLDEDPTAVTTAYLLDQFEVQLQDENNEYLLDESVFVPPPFVAPSPFFVIESFKRARWTFAVIGCASRTFGGRELATATGRSVTWRVDGPTSVQFSIDGRANEAADIVELASDVLVRRDGISIARCRIGPSSDDINADHHRCQFTGVDYRSLLATRVTGAAGGLYTNVDQVAIMWDLIVQSQALPGGNWGITYGTQEAPAQVRQKTIDPGKPVLDSMNEISRLDNGCEWEITPTLAFKTYAARGTDRGVVLDYGGLVTAVGRQLPMEYANSVLVTGGQDPDGTAPVPVTSTSATVAADPAGRWEMSAGYPTLTRQSTLDARGLWMLGQMQLLRPTVSIKLKAGVWSGFTHIGLGDTVRLVVKSGRLQTQALHRVVEINASIDADSQETITMGLIAS